MLNLDPVVIERILELALEGEKVEGEHTVVKDCASA